MMRTGEGYQVFDDDARSNKASHPSMTSVGTFPRGWILQWVVSADQTSSGRNW